MQRNFLERLLRALRSAVLAAWVAGSTGVAGGAVGAGATEPVDPAGIASEPADAAAPASTPIKVERAEPRKETLATLRFLRENRDFLRRRVDLLRIIPLETSGGAAALDPRFLAHGEVLAGALRDLDTLRTAAEERALLQSITELGDLEAELDRLEALLVDQNTRLALLEEDFLRHQGTELVVVLRGMPEGGLPDSIRVVDGFGDVHAVPLSAEMAEALRTGGILEVAHLRAEPREQSWSVTTGGAAWSPTPSPVTFEPPRRRLTYLEFDLTGARPEAGAGGLAVMAWVDTGTPAPARGLESR